MPYADPDDDREIEASGACAYCGQPLTEAVPETAFADE